jgi:hypothetical protein
MKNLTTKSLTDKILVLLPYFIIILIVIAACNHTSVNIFTKGDLSCTPKDTLKRESMCMKDTNIISKDTILCKKKQCESEFYKKQKEDICREIKIEETKKLFFDSNTVTYLITLIVALILTTVITTQREIRKEVERYSDGLKQYSDELEKYKKLLPELEEYNSKFKQYSDELKILIPEFKESNSLYVRVESIYMESCVLEQALSANKLVLNTRIMEIIYSMDRKIHSISMLIQKHNITKIPEDIRWEIVATIDNAINIIKIDKIKDKNPENTRYLEDMYDNLNELKDVIVNMNAIDV